MMNSHDKMNVQEDIVHVEVPSNAGDSHQFRTSSFARALRREEGIHDFEFFETEDGESIVIIDGLRTAVSEVLLMFGYDDGVEAYEV